LTRTQAVQETSLLSKHSGLLQRCGCAKKPSGSAEECPECKKKREAGATLQRISAQASAPTPVSSEAPPIVHEVLRSPGQPLNQASRAFMEPRFGYDFSRVRVHTDSRAAKSAEAVNAQAYTVGSNIVFGANPGGAENLSHQRLLAHELAHVVQQGGRQPGGSLQVAPATDRAEGEADRAADQVLSGGQATNATKAEGRLQRYTLKGFPPTEEAAMNTAIPIASSTMRSCKGPWLNDSIASKLDSATYEYNANLGLCGHSYPVPWSNIEVGSSAFSLATCCKLESTLAHEASHTRGFVEPRARKLECDCFSCSC
jgi:hypothetical protein